MNGGWRKVEAYDPFHPPKPYTASEAAAVIGIQLRWLGVVVADALPLPHGRMNDARNRICFGLLARWATAVQSVADHRRNIESQVP